MSQNKAAKRHTASLVMLRTGTFRHKVNVVRRSIKNVGTFDSHNSNKFGIGNIELYNNITSIQVIGVFFLKNMHEHTEHL